MNFSVDTECGYIIMMEGTSVEYVLARPGGKYINKHLSQNNHANFGILK